MSIQTQITNLPPVILFKVSKYLAKMGNLLGKKDAGKSRITEQDKAVLGLKQQRDKLNQYKRRVEQNLEKERAVAKTLLKQGKKDKALLLLKKKRYQENLLTKCDSQVDTIQQMIDNLEFAQIELKVVEDLKAGNESLKQLHSLMSVEDVERILDETREGVEYQREIDHLLSGFSDQLTSDDEDAILTELEALTAADDEPTKENIPTAEATETQSDPQPSFPDVPTTDPAEEDDRKREQIKAAASSKKKRREADSAAVAMLAS